MSEIANQKLGGVAETLLVTLYLRAMESQRPDALIKDEKAVALVAQMSHDFARIRQIPLSEANKLVIILRNREFDRYARDFLVRYPDAVVVHIGCGFDSRFERNNIHIITDDIVVASGHKPSAGNPVNNSSSVELNSKPWSNQI